MSFCYPHSMKNALGVPCPDCLIDQLRARVVELEKDKARLDFVLNHHKYETWMNYEGKFFCEDNETDAEDMIGFDTWEQAIDNARAAMQKGEKS